MAAYDWRDRHDASKDTALPPWQGRKVSISDVVVGQTLRYMGWIQEHLCSKEQSVKGSIIAHAQDEKLQYALKQVPNITFLKYEVDFRLVG